MMLVLFSTWLSHFKRALGSRGGISHENRHLLIVDGHNFHVTVKVVLQAMKVSLDLLTLPSYISHKLQPLDVGVFASYKRAFKQYRDVWVLRHIGSPAKKQTLAMWVSLGLLRALSKSNIVGRFQARGIWPYNEHAVDKFLEPSLQFLTTIIVAAGDECQQTTMENEQLDSESSEYEDEREDLAFQDIEGGRIPAARETPQHFFVPTVVDDSKTKSFDSIDKMQVRWSLTFHILVLCSSTHES